MKVKTTRTPYERFRSMRMRQIPGIILVLFTIFFIFWYMAITGVSVETYVVVTSMVGCLLGLVIYWIWHLYKTECLFESGEIDVSNQERIIHSLIVKMKIHLGVCLLVGVFCFVVSIILSKS